MPPISILIADDDAMIRRCLRRAVESDPQLQICWEADNGLQALMLAQQHHPQIALLDAQMPRMDGIEVTRCLRQQDPDVCIVVMSVYDQLRSEAMAAGADAFLTKDCGCQMFRTTLHRLVEEKNSS